MADSIKKRLEMIFSVSGVESGIAKIKEFAKSFFFISESIKTIVNLAKQLVSSFNAVAAAGDKFDDLSKRVGISANVLSKYDYVSKLVGTSIDEVAFGLKNLARSMGEADKSTSNAGKILSQMGISTRDATGQLKSTDAMLMEFADKFRQIRSETQQTIVAQEMFGRGGMAMIPILNQGSEAIKKQMQDAEDLGIAWSDEAARGASDYMDALTRLEGAWEGFKRRIIMPMAEALTPIFEELAVKIGTISKAIDDIGWGAVIENWGIVWDGAWEMFKATVDNMAAYIKNKLFSIDWKELFRFDKIFTKEKFEEVNVQGIMDETIKKLQRAAFYAAETIPTKPGTPIKPIIKPDQNKTLEILGLGAPKEAAVKIDEWTRDTMAKYKELQEKTHIYRPGELTPLEMEMAQAEQERLEQLKVDIQSVTQSAAGAFSNLFDFIAVNANNAERQTLNALTSIVNAVPQVLTSINAIQVAKNGLQMGAGVFGIIGAGVGLLTSLFAGGKKDEQKAADQAAQDRRARSYGQTTRATPQYITIAPQVIITGEVQYLGVDGTVMGERVSNLIVTKFKEAMENNTLSVAGSVA